MRLEPDARLVVNRELDLRKLPLTPIDFFLFSRVEALAGSSAPTVADVIAASGQPSDSAEQALAKLVELGALIAEAREANPPSRAEPVRTRKRTISDPELRKRARERKKGLLAAQMRVVKGVARPGEGAPSEESESQVEEAEPEFAALIDEEPSLPIARDDQKPAEPAMVQPRSILDEVEPVSEDDGRLDPGVAVPVERQRRLLALRDRLRHIGHFELLGLEPIDDTKVIRRAYHVTSREFHPDSYYGKDLGRYRGVLDDLFRRARSSYEFLLDPVRRKTLVDAHEAQVREERERRAQAEAEARAAAHQAAEDERRVAEALAREREEEARHAREARDRERQKSLRDRALRHRRKQAEDHAEQARRELELGRFGAAATLFRLAHDEDPGNAEYEREWRESLAIARRHRAELSFTHGRHALQTGRVQDAARWFTEAAEADPSLRNLTEAAAVVSEVDPAQARSFAMAALEALQQARARGLTLDDRTVANVHQACARAFLAVGQLATAKEQAERAHQLAPSKQTRALLNSIKLT